MKPYLAPADPSGGTPHGGRGLAGSCAHSPVAIACDTGGTGALEAARRYAETLRGVGDFDLVLLGLGEDGHTASLFPGHEWGASPGSPDTLAVLDAPKPPQQRVSFVRLG